MNETSNAIINNIICQYTKPIEEVLHGWIILIDGSGMEISFRYKKFYI